VDIAILSHRHFDHISGFDYMLKVKPTVKAYLPADSALGAPMRFTFSHDSKESLAGLPPEQLYFGGTMNSMNDFKPGDRFHGANQEFVPASREIASGIYLIVTRSVMQGDSTPIRRMSPDIRTTWVSRSCPWRSRRKKELF